MDILGGFYTEELLDGNTRQGFFVKTFEGKSGILARKGMKSAFKLNKYGIDMDVIEGLCVPALLDALKNKAVIVIDEIGSIETLSSVFRKTVFECLNSSKSVFATIRFNSQPFTDEVKEIQDTDMVYLDRSNFSETKRRVKEWFSYAAEKKNNP